MDAQKKILDELSVGDDKVIPELFQQKADIKKAIHEKRQEIKADKDEFFKAKRAFYEHTQEQRRIREEEYKKRQEEEAAREAAREAAGEAAPVEGEEGEKEHPWSAELWICDLLTKYFAKLAPKTETVAVAAAAPELTAELKGLKSAVGKGVRAGGDDDLSFFDGAPKKGKGKQTKPAAKAPKERVFTHDFETLGMFEKLSLTPPTVPSEVPATLTAIAEKRAYFDALPPKAKPAKAVAAAASPKPRASVGAGAAAAGAGAASASVTTPYGTGKVKETRSDGVVVVKMDSFEAVAYLQPAQISS